MAASQTGGGDKIVNKLSYSIGRLDRVTFTFQYPVESDVAIYFLQNQMGETKNPIIMTKGENTITRTPDAYITNNSITLTRIVPNEDNAYIYTW